MVDRATFRRLNPNHTLPTPVPPKMAGDSDAATSDPRFRTPNGFDEYGNPLPFPPVPQITGMSRHLYSVLLFIFAADALAQHSASDTSEVELTESDLLLTPTTVLGFSLSDKVWCTFSQPLTCARGPD